MRYAVLLVATLGWIASPALAQTPPAQPPAPAPKPQTRPAAATRPTVTVLVTDLAGKPLPDVEVTASGPVRRQGTTDAQGSIAFRNMTAGDYRLHFEHDGYLTLERDITVGSRALRPTVSLSPAPAPPPPPEPKPEPPPAPAAAAPSAPPATATSVDMTDFIEKNYVGSAPSRMAVMGCAPTGTATLIQLREPLAQHSHADGDEMIYVIAGEGTHQLSGREFSLAAGMFSVVPRGMPHTLTRRGSRPLIFMSFLMGPPCHGG